MRILILNIILTVFIVNSSAQNYEFKKWLYPWDPPLGGYNDSILGDYDENKDIILQFEPNEHVICNIKIVKKNLKYYHFRLYFIAEIEIVDILWRHSNINLNIINEIKYCILPFGSNFNKYEIIIGTFSVSNIYLSFQKELNLKNNTRYFISQPIFISCETGINVFNKQIEKLEKI